jgi:hypothetical protein
MCFTDISAPVCNALWIATGLGVDILRVDMKSLATWRVALFLLLGAVGWSAAQAQDKVGFWFEDFWIEAPVLQLAAMPEQNPGAAQAYLNQAGLGDFDYTPPSPWEFCPPPALLFTHPSASAAPILDAVAQLAEDPENPYFWTFLLGEGYGGLVWPIYYLEFPAPTVPADVEALLAELDIEATIEGGVSPNGSSFYEVRPATRSALDVLDQLNRLHDHPGDQEASLYFPAGCPSGGGGPQLPGQPPAVPALDRWSILVFLALLFFFAVRTLRHRRSQPPKLRSG